MVNNAILIHGKPSEAEYREVKGPSPSNRHWLAWLQHELLRRDIFTQTPEMPTPYAPDYIEWSTTFEQFRLSEDTILVGHSCGAGFIVRWLSEHEDQRLKKIILVAPSLALDWEDDSFLDFEIDPTIQERVSEVVIFIALNDRAGIRDAAKTINEALPAAKTVEFPEGGHFTYYGLGHTEFPELLEEVLR